MGVYARRDLLDSGVMKERVRSRQACGSSAFVTGCEREYVKRTNSDWSTMGARTNLGHPILS